MRHLIFKHGTISENNSIQVRFLFTEMASLMWLSKINQLTIILNDGNEDFAVTLFRDEYQEPKYKLASRITNSGELSIYA